MPLTIMRYSWMPGSSLSVVLHVPSLHFLNGLVVSVPSRKFPAMRTSCADGSWSFSVTFFLPRLSVISTMHRRKVSDVVPGERSATVRPLV